MFTYDYKVIMRLSDHKREHVLLRAIYTILYVCRGNTLLLYVTVDTQLCYKDYGHTNDDMTINVINNSLL